MMSEETLRALIVDDAWQKFPISLRGAIMAIVDLNCPAI